MDSTEGASDATKTPETEQTANQAENLFQTEPLWEEVLPEDAQQHGGLRATRHLKADNQNYLSITPSGFAIDAHEIIHINGWEDGAGSKPMTLLVVKVLVHSTERGFKFKSVTTTFTFEGGDKNHGSGPAAPVLVGFAPFSSTVQWNLSEEQKERVLNAGGTLGGGYAGATIAVTAGGQWKVAKTQKFAAKGNATPLPSKIDDERRNGVRWYMEHNTSQDDEVAPEFLVAIMIRRATKDDLFTGDFRLRVEGGTWSQLQQDLRRAFQIDPARTLKAFNAGETVRLTAEGEKIAKACDIKSEKLGSLRDGDNLTGLAHVWGLDPVPPN
jgi:hypothetical protein